MGASFVKQSSDKMSNPEKKGPKKDVKQGQSNSIARPLSIEGPSTSNSAEQIPPQPLPNQPRQPTNLQGLLKYAMDAAQSEDLENKPQVYPLDEEKKIFLNEALSSLTVNVIEELQKAVQILSNVVNLRVDDDSSEYESVLERMTDFVDNIDIANDFYKIGGFSIFQPCLNSSHSNIRWRTADIIAELAQNNPFCQNKLLETGVFPVLLSMIDTDPSEQARIKALYAVSCIVRGYPASLQYMDMNDGYSVLLRAMQSPVEKLQIKSAFLLSSLCSRNNSNNIKYTLIKMGFIEQAAGLLGRMNLQPTVREQLLRVLSGMINDNFLPALKECRRSQLCLRSTLEQLLTELKPVENQDEIDMCSELLDKVFSESDTYQER
ncbi:PREDICTED: hsp70-binding protein 1 [Cyphomyrmex costatus]|uniref:Hsp70-binding protein 1 n=1 Tax=Cyphomyrmex costatus TaxID=456900 RepID=A0A195C632_9HYME|nr:PREDICTED: hsp70-binding protein 1 [Cyphomyrmex costatus]KYM96307.1 Hsp70-binding protein 1 [Cyphomyrmex costatus]